MHVYIANWIEKYVVCSVDSIMYSWQRGRPNWVMSCGASRVSGPGDELRDAAARGLVRGMNLWASMGRRLNLLYIINLK